MNRKILVAALASMLIAIISSKIVYAGEVNSFEEYILTLLSGTFEYEGIVYVAGPGKLDEAREYLSRDDVDLTEDQRAELEELFFLNLEQAIVEEYMVPRDSMPEEIPEDEIAIEENSSEKEESIIKNTGFHLQRVNMVLIAMGTSMIAVILYINKYQLITGGRSIT